MIMPFRDDLERHFDLVSRCGTELGLRVERVDTGAYSGSILQAIARGLAKADLIIADLTEANPNVMYELAVAHCLGKKVLLVTNDMNTVPFDIRSYRVEKLDPSSQQCADQLRKAMRAILQATYVIGPLGGAVIIGERLFLSRLLAWIIDLSPLIAGVLAWWYGVFVIDKDAELSWILSSVVGVYLLYIGMTTAMLGGTLGQRLLGIRVVTLDGEGLSVWHAVGRACLAGFFTPMTYGLNFLWALKQPGYRALHDIASRTMVVKD